MSWKLYLREHWCRVDSVLFILCPVFITVGQLLEWIFPEIFASNSGGWVIGGTEG